MGWSPASSRWRMRESSPCSTWLSPPSGCARGRRVPHGPRPHVVLLLNPVYMRTQKLVDRVFFRERRDVERALERLSDDMTTLRDLDRIVALIHGMVEEFFRPARLSVLVLDAERGELPGGGRRCRRHRSGRFLRFGARALPRRGARAAHARARRGGSGARGRIESGRWPTGGARRCARRCPSSSGGGVTGILALGDKRSGAAYSTFDLRVLRFVANQSAVALENARAYTALQRANTELRHALRRVEILESIRASLVQVRSRDGAAADRGGARVARARQATRGRLRALRRHRGLHEADRAPGLEPREPARRTVLRRVPRRDPAARRRRERDGGRRPHGDLPGRRPAAPRALRHPDRAVASWSARDRSAATPRAPSDPSRSTSA